MLETILVHENLKIVESNVLLATNELEDTDHELVNHFNTLSVSAACSCSTGDDGIWSDFCQHENLFTIWLKATNDGFDKSFLFHALKNQVQLSIVHCICLDAWILR